jgi:hypothetical protein
VRASSESSRSCTPSAPLTRATSTRSFTSSSAPHLRATGSSVVVRSYSRAAVVLRPGRDVEEDLELDRARVLHLIDEHVRDVERAAFTIEQRSAKHLEEAKEDRAILEVERRHVAIALAFDANARLPHGPILNLIELARSEERAEVAIEPRAVRGHVVPRDEHVAGL